MPSRWSTMNFASSSVKHMGGLILSTFLWGPSALRSTPFSFILISAGKDHEYMQWGWRAVSTCSGGWVAVSTCSGGEGQWAHAVRMGGHEHMQWKWGVMNLLIDDVLGFSCCRRPFLMVLHQINANKKADTSEEEEKESMCTLWALHCHQMTFNVKLSVTLSGNATDFN